MQLRTTFAPRHRRALHRWSRRRAAAQAGRVGGIVKDDKGEPIKGATVTAENPNIGAELHGDDRRQRAGSP